MTRDTVVLTDKTGKPVQIRRVIRQALVLDTDESLVAASLIVADPTQSAPVPVRSVYRKAF